MDNRSKLLAYLKGWAHGAGHKSFQHPDVPDYCAGFSAGRVAYHQAAAEAQERYGEKLSIIRTQGSDTHEF